MARLFDDASSQYLIYGNRLVDAYPVTMAAWFNSDSLTLNQAILGFQNSGSAHCLYLVAAGADTGDYVKAYFVNNAAFGGAVSTASYTANTWHHGCAVYSSSTSFAAYLNGANKGTNNPGLAWDVYDRTMIGARHTGSIERFMSGSIADAAMWNVSLTDAEVAVLALGYSPLFVRPQNLLAYWPLIGRTSPEIDIVGGYAMTLGNAPTVSAHPRLRYPYQLVMPRTGPAAPAGTLRHLALLGVG